MNQVKEAEEAEEKVAELSARRDELARKIRELGTLPADAFDKYRSKGLKDLIKQLPKVGRWGWGWPGWCSWCWLCDMVWVTCAGWCVRLCRCAAAMYCCRLCVHLVAAL